MGCHPSAPSSTARRNALGTPSHPRTLRSGCGGSAAQAKSSLRPRPTLGQPSSRTKAESPPIIGPLPRSAIPVRSDLLSRRPFASAALFLKRRTVSPGSETRAANGSKTQPLSMPPYGGAGKTSGPPFQVSPRPEKPS
eukprot:16430212-Heterocapsa_arctica.AAC.7